jgi:hypothetical protein
MDFQRLDRWQGLMLLGALISYSHRKIEFPKSVNDFAMSLYAPDSRATEEEIASNLQVMVDAITQVEPDFTVEAMIEKANEGRPEDEKFLGSLL